MVTTNGIVQVLVSDINGEIKKGDHVTASTIKGVGMKATGNTRIVGIAQEDMQKAAGNEQKYTDGSGKEQTVYLGQVAVMVNVAYYFKEPEKTIVPPAIQDLANALAGKQVNTLPIIISAAIFVVTLIVVASIIYSMVRGSIISVGRNPLSQAAVYRNIIQLSALVIAILAVSFAIIYVILKRL